MAMIHVNRGGTNLGTFSEEDVRAGLSAGRFVGTDLGWREGMAQWQPLSQFAEFAAATPDAGSTTPVPPAAVPATVVTHPPTATVKVEPLAIWSLVLSALGLVCCGFILGIPGVICGHIALSKIRTQPGLEGRGLAIAGLVIGYASIAFWLIWILCFGGLSFLHSITNSG
jgi:Domain of unknown function (DUF4190)/GYF domain 2